jgi:hypothetical protein
LWQNDRATERCIQRLRYQCKRAAPTAENELLERAERVFNVPKPGRVTLAPGQKLSRDELQGFTLADDACGDRLRAEADEGPDSPSGALKKHKVLKIVTLTQ